MDTGILRIQMSGEATPLQPGTVTIRAVYFGPGAEEVDLVLEKTVTVDL